MSTIAESVKGGNGDRRHVLQRGGDWESEQKGIVGKMGVRIAVLSHRNGTNVTVVPQFLRKGR